MKNIDELKLLNVFMTIAAVMVLASYICTMYVASQTTSYDANLKGVAAFLG